MMFPSHGVRIAVDGEGDLERFTVFIDPETPKAPGHVLNSIGPMTEDEFRVDMRGRDISEDKIEQTIRDARAHARQQRELK